MRAYPVIRRRAVRILAAASVLWAAAAGAVRADSRAVSLVEFMRGYGFSAPVVSGDTLRFGSPWTTVVLEQGSRRLLWNGRLVYLNGAVDKAGAGWTLAGSDAETVLGPLLRYQDVLRGRGSRVIVLDPGHGGADKGAVSRRRVEEKRVTLDIAKRVREKLGGLGLEVRLTRDDDVAVSLDERSRRAAAWGADLYVSIHMNATANRGVRGVETYVLPAPGYSSTAGGGGEDGCAANRFDAASMVLAETVQSGLITHAKLEDRGIKRARYAVLRNAPCPAVLVECGFLTHPAEEALVIERTHRDALAEGIAQGIQRYVVRAREARAVSAR